MYDLLPVSEIVMEGSPNIVSVNDRVKAQTNLIKDMPVSITG